MKTSRLLIVTAAIIACAAPTASASPATDPATARAHEVPASTPATIAAHKEHLSTQQYMASSGRSVEATPLTDRTGTDSGVPLVLVLLGATIALTAAVAKPVRAYAAHRRAPTRVA